MLLIVGGGLFGSLAAAYARKKGIHSLVFEAGLPGAASPAAAGLFREDWAGRKYQQHFREALPLLDQLFGIRQITLTNPAGQEEHFLFVPPSAILEPTPVRAEVTAVGDGWLEAAGQRYQGSVYIAAGVWCERFLPGLGMRGKAGAAFLFAGEQPGAIRPLERGRQALRFVREPGSTYFSDGTAEIEYNQDHDRQTLARAAEMGLTAPPLARLWGRRPYVPGGPVLRRLGERTWLGTGGRKLGTILGAALARRLLDQEFRP